MKFRKHGFIVFLLFLISLVPVLAGAMETGTVAPDFRLKSLQGQEIRLTDFKGQMVLLKLGTTWCPTCKQLSAEINKVGELLKKYDVVVLDVFVQDTEEMIRSYLGETNPGMTFHALLDDDQVHESYGVYLIPRLLVVDAEQLIRFDSAGRNVFAEDIRNMVEAFGPHRSNGSPQEAQQ